ncbi:histone-lysine N-methyltransferase PRDM7-like [Narcine bancroftii]|uniref:histone-lysine N-methyltransferase PRDM7-like n=1 Tax=Narcine bancroftii TaxID=1343680 RepID=UPI003831EBE5
MRREDIISEIKRGKFLRKNKSFVTTIIFFVKIVRHFFIEECPVHGPPVFMKDTDVEFDHPDRASLTLLEGLSIAVSKIQKAGLGIWNEGKLIPRGVHFGSYEDQQDKQQH